LGKANNDNHKGFVATRIEQHVMSAEAERKEKKRKRL